MDHKQPCDVKSLQLRERPLIASICLWDKSEDVVEWFFIVQLHFVSFKQTVLGFLIFHWSRREISTQVATGASMFKITLKDELHHTHDASCVLKVSSKYIFSTCVLYGIGVKLLLLGEFGKIRQKISCQCGDLDHYALLDLIMSFQLGVPQSWVLWA